MERELLLMELISWHLFLGDIWRPGCPQSTWTHVWPLQQGRAAAGQSCRGGNRLGQNAMLIQPHQSQLGFLDSSTSVPSTPRSVLTLSQKGSCGRLGCREGRRRGSSCSFHSCTVPKGNLLRPQSLEPDVAPPSNSSVSVALTLKENVVFHQDSQLTLLNSNFLLY